MRPLRSFHLSSGVQREAPLGELKESLLATSPKVIMAVFIFYYLIGARIDDRHARQNDQFTSSMVAENCQ